jgi:hypothetical protein
VAAVTRNDLAAIRPSPSPETPPGR